MRTEGEEERKKTRRNYLNERQTGSKVEERGREGNEKEKLR